MNLSQKNLVIILYTLPSETRPALPKTDIYQHKFLKLIDNSVIHSFQCLGYSEWLLFNSAIFQLDHGENKLILNEMMMKSALYYTNMLSWIFIVLVHWNNSSGIDMSIHSNIILIPSQPVFALFPFQFYSLWFDTIYARTHYLSHSRRAR